MYIIKIYCIYNQEERTLLMTLLITYMLTCVSSIYVREYDCTEYATYSILMTYCIWLIYNQNMEHKQSIHVSLLIGYWTCMFPVSWGVGVVRTLVIFQDTSMFNLISGEISPKPAFELQDWTCFYLVKFPKYALLPRFIFTSKTSQNSLKQMFRVGFRALKSPPI